MGDIKEYTALMRDWYRQDPNLKAWPLCCKPEEILREMLRSPPDEKRSNHRTLRWINEVARNAKNNPTASVSNWRQYQLKFPAPEALVAASVLEFGNPASMRVLNMLRAFDGEWILNNECKPSSWWNGFNIASTTDAVTKVIERKPNFSDKCPFKVTNMAAYMAGEADNICLAKVNPSTERDHKNDGQDDTPKEIPEDESRTENPQEQAVDNLIVLDDDANECEDYTEDHTFEYGMFREKSEDELRTENQQDEAVEDLIVLDDDIPDETSLSQTATQDHEPVDTFEEIGVESDSFENLIKRFMQTGCWKIVEGRIQSIIKTILTDVCNQQSEMANEQSKMAKTLSDLVKEVRRGPDGKPEGTNPQVSATPDMPKPGKPEEPRRPVSATDKPQTKPSKPMAPNKPATPVKPIITTNTTEQLPVGFKKTSTMTPAPKSNRKTPQTPAPKKTTTTQDTCGSMSAASSRAWRKFEILAIYGDTIEFIDEKDTQHSGTGVRVSGHVLLANMVLDGKERRVPVIDLRNYDIHELSTFNIKKREDEYFLVD